MPDKLSLVGIVIVREIREFSCLPDIMADRRRIQKIPVQYAVSPGKILAQVENTQGMFQKSSRESVMYSLRGRVPFELPDEILIIDKIIFQQFPQILIGYLPDIGGQLLVHA